jgi:hypothetical protein
MPVAEHMEEVLKENSLVSPLAIRVEAAFSLQTKAASSRTM